MSSGTFQFRSVLSPLVNLFHLLKHLVAVIHHHREELIHFQLPQHAVDIEMIELQVEVGSHEVGEFIVVVLLIDLKQLCIQSGYDGKAVFAQLLAQLLVKLLDL